MAELTLKPDGQLHGEHFQQHHKRIYDWLHAF
jgi:hypothetical protein